MLNKNPRRDIADIPNDGTRIVAYLNNGAAVTGTAHNVLKTHVLGLPAWRVSIRTGKGRGMPATLFCMETGFPQDIHHWRLATSMDRDGERDTVWEGIYEWTRIRYRRRARFARR